MHRPNSLLEDILAFLAINICFMTLASGAINDVSTSVEQLGNPVQIAYPNDALSCAQDLQLFQGKIFLGYGNLDNRTAKSVIYLDPNTQTFATDYPGTLLNDEILHKFRVFGSEMYLESFDPIALSNLYLRRTNGWSVTSMNFPGSGRHNFDIYKYNGVLFTGGGFGFPGIAISFDAGTNWSLPGASITNSVFNNSEFFDFNGQLYVSQDLSLAALFPGLLAPFVLKYTGTTNTPFTTLFDQPADFYPPSDLNQGRISHFEKLRSQGVFIGDGGIYVVSSIEPPVLTKATLPNGLGDYAVDLLGRTNGVYFLASVPQLSNPQYPYLGIIGKSEDLQNWIEICRFGAREVIQSFETFGGDFYVGLGNYLTTSNAHSGDMLRIPKLAANEESSVVIPASLEFTNGRAGNLFPFGFQQPVRYQQVYSSSAFSSVTGPQLITHVAFRPSISQGQTFTNTVKNLRIDLTTTAASPTIGLSTQFALNLGSDLTTVFTGAVVLASSFVGPATGPKAFDVEIALQRPFVYDPAAGNLLLDVYDFSGSLCTPLDITWGAGLPSSRMVSSAGGVTNTTGVADLISTCLITRFKMAAAALTNRPPLVFAGAPQTLTWPQTAFLSGTASDDGLPDPPSTLAVQWSKVSGPGSVSFSSAQSLSTSATFSDTGLYVLRLTVSDWALSASSDVSINVLPMPPVNLAPVVDAGANQSISWTNRSAGTLNAAYLNGLVADDGYQQPPGVTTSLWVQVSGPGTILFETPSEPLTSARFTLPGKYVMRLIANDGALLGSNDVAISALDVPGVNQAPAVNAGPELTATQLEPVLLNGAVSDDGLPSMGALSVQWMTVDGPGAVVFATPSNATALATFPSPGKYVVRLTASDGALAASADTTVHVLNGNFAVVPNALSGANGRGGNGYPFNIPDSVRYQQVYASSQFSSNTGPFLVTEIAFRPSASAGSSFTSAIPQIVIELSTTSANPEPSLSSTFADNVGPDKQVVFNGPLTLSSRFAGTGPKAFDVIIPLQRAFLYEPRKGNLLVDIRNVFGSQTTYFDITWGTGTPSSRMVSRAGGVNDAQGTADSSPTALATRFILSRLPVPILNITEGTNFLSIGCDSVFGQPMVLEESTNLTDWTALQTNVLLFRPLEVDTFLPITGHRFYRSRVSP